MRQGWISREEVTQEVLEGFLSKYGRDFYKIADLDHHASSGPRIRLTRRGELIPQSVKSLNEEIEIVPFQSGQEIMSLSWIE